MRLTLGLLAAGLVLMLVLELPILGVPVLFAFIVAGVFRIADPAFLAADGDDDVRRGRSG